MAAAEAVLDCCLEPDSSAEAHHTAWYVAMSVMQAILHADTVPAAHLLAAAIDARIENDAFDTDYSAWTQLRSEVIG
jgi:hypothetical protein